MAEMTKRLVIEIEGEDEVAMEEPLMEVLRLLRRGSTRGADSNDTNSYSFDVTDVSEGR